MQQIEQETSGGRVHVIGIPTHHGRLVELEEEEDSCMQEEQELIIVKKKKKMQEEDEQPLNELIASQELKPPASPSKTFLEVKAYVVQNLKKLGFSVSEDRVVHKTMEGQVKQFEYWGDVSTKTLTDAQDQIEARVYRIIFAQILILLGLTVIFDGITTKNVLIVIVELIITLSCLTNKLTDAQDQIETRVYRIMFAHILILIGLTAIFDVSSTTKNVLIVELTISLIILSVINIILLCNCHKQWFKLRGKAKELFMEVKNTRSNLVYVPRSHLDADEDADLKIGLACVRAARPWKSMSVLFVVVSLLISIDLSFIGFLKLWNPWHAMN